MPWQRLRRGDRGGHGSKAKVFKEYSMCLVSKPLRNPAPERGEPCALLSATGSPQRGCKASSNSREKEVHLQEKGVKEKWYGETLQPKPSFYLLAKRLQQWCERSSSPLGYFLGRFFLRGRRHEGSRWSGLLSADRPFPSSAGFPGEWLVDPESGPGRRRSRYRKSWSRKVFSNALTDDAFSP